MQRILVTGAEGLVGRALCARLEAVGHEVMRLDLRAEHAPSRGDVRNVASLDSRIEPCDGVVHLAAVSRVITAEHHPELCQTTNVEALRGLLRAAATCARRPWVLFASSREVYGQPKVLPATEDAELLPVNVYGRSKVAGEALCAEALEAGLRTATVRLSNVYGSAHDHADRVAPAFARAALAGESLRVDGAASTFDFTHIDDVVDGICALIDVLVNERRPPPALHLTTGLPTTLKELASTIIRLADSRVAIVEARPRTYDVARFFGDPSRARSLLGWRASVPLEVGLRRLVDELRRAGARDEALVGGGAR